MQQENNFQDVIQSIRSCLTYKTLPGKEAHIKLAPFKSRLDYVVPHGVHEASVIILLYPDSNNIKFPIIIRQSLHEADKHKGQIGLPGGRKDLTDKSHAYTAMRECEEEIGIPQSDINIIGALSQLYIPVSNHLVFPFLGYVNYTPEFVIQDSEIKAIHSLDLQKITLEEIRLKKTVQTTEGFPFEVPCIQYDEHTIWGATGMIIEEFSAIIKSL